MAEMPGSPKCVQIAETSGISQIYVVTLKALLVTLFEKVTNNVTVSGVDMGGGQRGQLCDHWFPRFSQTLICTVGNLKKMLYLESKRTFMLQRPPFFSKKNASQL